MPDHVEINPAAIPIPNLTELRQTKNGYDTRYEINTEHPLYRDPLVDPREDEFGFFDASSYYAKPNKITGETLPGVPDAPLLRLDVARRLVLANVFLQTDCDVREALGAPARLRIDDALRPYQVQKYAYEVAWPSVIRSAHPEMSDEEIKKELPNYIAKPNDKLTPTPHLTGGAVDVALINVDTNEAFDRGHRSGKVKGTAYPDFHEGYHTKLGESDIANTTDQAQVAPRHSQIVLARRILYFAMTEVGGMHVNPTEIWHYGKGDPLSEFVSGSHHPYHGIAELPDWYLHQMHAK